MGTNIKLSDIDYCYASWKLLKDLEEDSFARNEEIRHFHEKSDARESKFIGGLSLILPAILWGFLLLSPGGISATFSGNKSIMTNVGTRFVGLLFLSAFAFLIVFLLLRSLWGSKLLSPLKNFAERDLKKKLLKDIQKIDGEVNEIISNPLFQEGRIPSDFLSAELLPILIRYFESGQVTFMKEAIYSLKLELQNAGHYQSVVPMATLFQKEADYLSDRENNLKKKIEMSEIR